MTDEQRTEQRPGSFASIAALTSPGLGFVIPFLGPWASMVAVVLATRHASHAVWPARRSRFLAPVGIAALWGPALLSLVFLTTFGDRLGSPETSERLQRVSGLIDTVGMTFWLFLPLAAPDDIVTPAVAACVVLAVGATGSAYAQRAWPWLLGAVLAPLTYAAVVLGLGIRFTA